MTSVLLVDSGGTVVEYVTADEEDSPQQEAECDLEFEGDLEGECEAEEDFDEAQDGEEDDNCPAVIVEEVPGAGLGGERGYPAQVFIYNDEVYLMQGVGDEQDVETEGEAVEASVHGTNVHCSDKTFEAAEALLRMDSPSSLREDRSPEAFIPPYMTTPDFLHAAMRPDMISETEVEISTEGCCEEEDEEILLEPVRKSRGKRRYPAGGSAAMVAGISRIMSVPGAFDGSQQAHTAIIRTSTGPRTVRVAMQVPVVMTTSLGQKISTVAVQQPAGAAGHSALLTNTSAIGAAANANSQQKVMIQTIPTMVPATAENGEKITVQLAKIITIPAHQLAQYQSSTGSNKSSVGNSPAGISLLRNPLTVRALAPVNVAAGTQVMRLTVPTQTQQQTLVVSQPGSGPGVVTVSTASQTVPAHPPIISGILSGSELVIGAPGTGGVSMEKLKAAGVQVQTVQVAVQQNQGNPKTLQTLQSDAQDAEVVIKLETPDKTIKSEEPEC
ncbi:ETS-related transcription factor Elf-2 [Pungitius pungitius]|uniref:ETS-related transcription factor Elf-2 n=1 Tax=Pungitius pungitius TaxID=134920 RepID=UPI002E0EFD6D